ISADRCCASGERKIEWQDQSELVRHSMREATLRCGQQSDLLLSASNLRLHVIARLSLNGFSKAWRKSRPSSVACAQSVVGPQPPSNPRLKTDVENARLSGSLMRHGLAVWRSAEKEASVMVRAISIDSGDVTAASTNT